VGQNNMFRVAVIGATGLVGKEMLAILEERNFPVKEIFLFASELSAGEKIPFRGEEIEIRALNNDSISSTEVDISLWSIGAELSKKYIPLASKNGWICIDNSSAFRMDDEVPLIVPEVNAPAVQECVPGLIIANPNCSTIQLVQILKPLHKQFDLKRVVLATYQSVSGAGKRGSEELGDQTVKLLNSQKVESKVFPHPIAFTILPQIDDFLPDGYTKEEVKVMNETRKILELPDLPITATCARVPVFSSHSEAVNIEFNERITVEEVRELLSQTPGVKVEDDPTRSVYPLNTEAAGKDETFVGRIRIDESVEHGINLWIVSDNLRKGAALNAVQIAEMVSSKL